MTRPSFRGPQSANPESRAVTSGFRAHRRAMPRNRVLLLPGLRAKARFLLTQFGRQRLAKIFRIEDLPDFNFGAAVERRTFHPVDRLIQRFHLYKPKAGDKIAGHGEWTMAHAGLFSGIFDPGAFRRRMQALARQHNARFHHLLVELAHRRQHFGARHHAGLAVLVGLYNHHESHRHAPLFNSGGRLRTSAHSQDEPSFAAPTCPAKIISGVIAGSYLGNIAKYASASLGTPAEGGRAPSPPRCAATLLR